jgi:hypothetical protein
VGYELKRVRNGLVSRFTSLPVYPFTKPSFYFFRTFAPTKLTNKTLPVMKLSDWFHVFRIFGCTSLVLMLLAITSCMKKEDFSDVPQIAFENFTLEFDSGDFAVRGYLTISFKDGDGDIGLRPDQNEPPFDSLSKYYYNYIIDYYEKQNGKFVKVNLNPTLYARIPYLTPNDPNKAIKGFIVDTLPLNPAPVFDTIKLKFFIYDRALNPSNVDSTPPIILRRR